MKLLLDTHAVVWAVLSVDKLSFAAIEAITSPQNTVFVSIASPWEIAIKTGLGKWPEARSLIDTFEASMQMAGFELLPITVPHVREAGFLRSPHRDPFDRVLASQAKIEGLQLVTADAKLKALAGPVIW